MSKHEGETTNSAGKDNNSHTKKDDTNANLTKNSSSDPKQETTEQTDKPKRAIGPAPEVEINPVTGKPIDKNDQMTTTTPTEAQGAEEQEPQQKEPQEQESQEQESQEQETQEQESQAQEPQEQEPQEQEPQEQETQEQETQEQETQEQETQEQETQEQEPQEEEANTQETQNQKPFFDQSAHHTETQTPSDDHSEQQQTDSKAKQSHNPFESTASFFASEDNTNAEDQPSKSDIPDLETLLKTHTPNQAENSDNQDKDQYTTETTTEQNESGFWSTYNKDTEFDSSQTNASPSSDITDDETASKTETKSVTNSNEGSQKQSNNLNTSSDTTKASHANDNQACKRLLIESYIAINQNHIAATKTLNHLYQTLTQEKANPQTTVKQLLIALSEQLEPGQAEDSELEQLTQQHEGNSPLEELDINQAQTLHAALRNAINDEFYQSRPHLSEFGLPHFLQDVLTHDAIIADNDLTQTDHTGRTPLHLASAMGYTNDVAEMLSQRSQSEREQLLSTVDNQGQTALHHATFYGHFNTIKALLGAGSGEISSQPDQFQQTPLDLAAYNNNWLSVSQLGQDSTPPSSQTIQASCDAMPNNSQQCQLLIALHMPIEHFADYLQNSKVDPLPTSLDEVWEQWSNLTQKPEQILQEVDSQGQNLLHTAAMTGNWPLFEAILKSPSSSAQKLLNTPDHNGDTPLHLATRYNQHSILEQAFQDNAFKKTLKWPVYSQDRHLVHVASQYSNAKTLQILKQRKLFQTNPLKSTDSQNNNVLHYAAANKTMDSDDVFDLLEQQLSKSWLGPKLTTRNLLGDNPLHVAARSNNPQALQAIFDITQNKKRNKVISSNKFKEALTQTSSYLENALTPIQQAAYTGSMDALVKFHTIEQQTSNAKLRKQLKQQLHKLFTTAKPYEQPQDYKEQQSNLNLAASTLLISMLEQEPALFNQTLHQIEEKQQSMVIKKACQLNHENKRYIQPFMQKVKEEQNNEDYKQAYQALNKAFSAKQSKQQEKDKPDSQPDTTKDEQPSEQTSPNPGGQT